MTLLPRLAHRILNRPHPIEPVAALAVLRAMAPRLGVAAIDAGWLADAAIEGEGPAVARRSATALPPAGVLRERGRPHALDPASGIAWVPIEGKLAHRTGNLDPWSGITGYDGVAAQLLSAATDPAVRGIVLDIDSPGGELAGVMATAETIRSVATAKPVWAIANDMAASAGYWLGSAAPSLFATPTAMVGSIGMVAMHVDMSHALDLEGLSVTLIHAGAHKVDGNPFQPLPEAVRDDWQREVDQAYGLFVDAVAFGRGVTAEAVRATEARTYGAAEAVRLGLVDDIGLPDEIMAEMAARLRAGGTSGGRMELAA